MNFMKNQIKSLAQKLLLGATMATGMIPSTPEAQAQHISKQVHVRTPYRSVDKSVHISPGSVNKSVHVQTPYAQVHRSVNVHSPIRTVYSPMHRNVNVGVHVGGVHVGVNTARYFGTFGTPAHVFYPSSQVYVKTVHYQEPVKNIEQGVQAHIYNFWQDDNIANGKVDLPGELKGRDKDTFFEDESFCLRLHTQGFKGKTARLELISPDKKKVDSESRTITHDFWQWSTKEDLEKLIQENGQGNYEARFFVDNQLVEQRPFELRSNISIGICNNWVDEDGNKKINQHTELKGLNKGVFNLDEKFTPVFFVRGCRGSTVDIKLYNPNGDLIRTNPLEMTANAGWLHYTEPVEKFVSKHGAGVYTAVYSLDGKDKGGMEFELTGHNQHGPVINGKQYPPETKYPSQAPEQIITPKPEPLEKILQPEEVDPSKEGIGHSQPNVKVQVENTLTPEQQTMVNVYWNTLSGRKQGISDPIGINLKVGDILELQGDFSEQNIRNYIQSKQR